MLKSWSVENFKAIVNSGDLQLAPVTVLAGLNSSGKSSLLQSILMISQTLSSRVLDRALLPNGPIVQLGTFEDILSNNVEVDTVTISFHLAVTSEIYPDNIDIEELLSTISAEGSVLKKIKVSIKFKRISNDLQGLADNINIVVDNLSISVNQYYVVSDRDQPDKYQINDNTSFLVEKLSEAGFNNFIGNIRGNYLQLLTPVEERRKYAGKESENTSAETFIVTLSHFLPDKIIRKFNETERLTTDTLIKQFLLEDTLSALLTCVFPEKLASVPHDITNPLNINIDDIMVQDVIFALNDFSRKEMVNQVFGGKTLRDLIHWYRSLSIPETQNKNFLNQIQKLIVENYFNINEIMKNLGNSYGLEAVTDDTNILYIQNAVAETTKFFTSKIRYLGPLRADPQASQKFSPSSELDDVGTKGEYAGAVYDANQRLIIDWYNPDTQQVEKDTLRVALDTWAHYLGVAERIQIETAGQSGVSWQVVHAQGHRPLPLSAVGVGVSQVLPILVMGLLAPKGTLLLVEQPELHLHPRVQARLGDFFMGLAKCGKQCLIETHSENLISQLRYHIVAAGGQEQSDCRIYFVEQDQQGAARFDPIEISPEGNILNWPEGFFDETMLQEDRITALSVKKRAAKQKAKTEKQA